MVSWGLSGPVISTLKTFFEKAWFEAARPMASVASSIMRGSSLRFFSFPWKAVKLSASSIVKSSPGMILTVTFSAAVLRRTISVANRVHRLSLLGKGTSVIAYSTELFPAD